MNRDWLFKDEKSICNFRTVGVLIRGGKILLQREKEGNEYALPGGHVKSNETSEQSLIREYKEETNADIICERLIWIEESFWKWGDRDTSTIAFYYLIKLVNDADIPDDYFESQKDNCNVILEWVLIQDLKGLTVYPRFLVEKIDSISNGIEHFISVE
jgi:ADP-ribose pyrophosphatase